MPEMEVVSVYKYFIKKKIKPKFKLNTIVYRLFRLCSLLVVWDYSRNLLVSAAILGTIESVWPPGIGSCTLCTPRLIMTLKCTGAICNYSFK